MPHGHGEIVLGLCVPHTPRIAVRERAAPVFHEMIHALDRARDVLHAQRPDAIVLLSAHWATTFCLYVDAAAHHAGILTAHECPDLIASMPYDFPGDPELGAAIVAAGTAAAIPVVATANQHYVSDYGTVVPLSYLTPFGDIPVVPISTCLVSDLDEYFIFGAAIRDAIVATGRRAAVVASSAFAHNVVRGPETWPTEAERRLDDELIELLVRGDLSSARARLPDCARAAHYEMGGRPLAGLLGTLGSRFRGEFLAYGPSSGSGNPIIVFTREPALA